MTIKEELGDKSKNFSIEKITKNIEELQDYLKNISIKESITDEEKKNLVNISSFFNRIKNLTRGKKLRRGTT